MLFRTFDHYSCNNDFLVNNSDYCFICFDFINENEFPIQLNNKIYYFKSCNCDGLIHKKCFDTWYSKNYSCPVCRITVSKTPELLSNNLSVDSYFTSIYIVYVNNINRIKKYFVFMIFIYFISEFYFQAFNNSLY